MILKIEKFKWLIFLLLSFLVNLNSLLIYINSNGSSPKLLYDGDESFYLGLPNAAINGKYHEFYYQETLKKDWIDVLMSAPNAITDLSVGLTFGKLISSPILLGIVLDIICCWLTLVLSYKVFYLFFNEKLIAFIGASIYTFSPFAYAATLKLFDDVFNLFSGKYLKVFGYYTHNNSPAQRGIYTQLSLVLCNFALLIFIQGLQDYNKRKIFISALLFGCLIYVYPFTWMFAICNSCLLVTLIVLFSGDIKRKISYYFVNFLIPLLAISIPGLILALRMQGQFYLIDDLPNVIFFQPLSLIILIIEIIVYRRELDNSKARMISLLIISLVFSEIFLLNLETMGVSKFTIFHPLTFFLTPLMGTILFLQLTSSVIQVPLFKRSVQLLTIVLISARLLVCIDSPDFHKTITEEEGSDFLELVDYVKANTNLTDVFSLAPVKRSPDMEYRSMPNDFSLITGRSILSQFWSMPNPKNFLDFTWREIYSFYLFYHQFFLFDTCRYVKSSDFVFEPRLYYPPDRLTIKTRQMQCAYVEKLSKNEKKDLLAQFALKYKVNYILIEKIIFPDWQNYFRGENWQSKNGYFVLVKLS